MRRRFSDVMTMAEAAKALQIGRNQLFALLRRHRHFLPGNVPDLSLRRAGFFRIETRGFVHPGTCREMSYQRVVITTEGLLWLREQIRADRNGKAASPVGGGDRGAAGSGRAAASAAAGADASAADRADASEKPVGASTAPL